MKESEKEIINKLKAQNVKTMELNQKSEPDEWEKPTPFDSVFLPAFPIDALPPTLRNYVLAVSEATQTPVDMAAVAGLAVMAVCVQGKFKIRGKPDWIEPLNLYSVIVANPAERKSAILSLLTKFIDEYESSYNELHMPEVSRNRLEKKVLQKELDKLTESVVKDGNLKDELMQKQDELSRFKDIKPLRLLADDASAEALTSLLASNDGKMSVISSEGGIFEILQGRYSAGVNIDTFLKAHCGDTIRIDRKGRESELIKDPCLTVLLSIQPQVLDGLISNEVFRGRGLTARFLYSIPISSVGGRRFETETIPRGYIDSYRELCFDLLRLNHEKPVEILTLSEEAHILSAQFAEYLEPLLIDELEGMADFAGKLHGTALRIAGILHLVGQLVFAPGTPIPRETMKDAIALGLYFLQHAKSAYQLMGADKQIQGAKYVLKKLEAQPERHLKRYSVFKMCRSANIKNVDDIDPFISLLIDYNYLRELPAVERVGAGRKSDVLFELNPHHFSKTMV